MDDDKDMRNFRNRMRTWEKRITTLSDELLIYIIQCATYQLTMRSEKLYVKK